METLVGLADAIEALRAELTAAWLTGRHDSVRFKAQSVQLTLQAAVTNTRDGKGGVKWWLVEAGAEGSRSKATTQTLVLTLQPTLGPKELDLTIDGPGTRP